jgi:hypothetical protein
MPKRTITDRDGKPVEIEIDDPPQEQPVIDRMIEILQLAKHIADNPQIFPNVWLPGHPASPKNRKKKKEQ